MTHLKIPWVLKERIKYGGKICAEKYGAREKNITLVLF
jgi:hypothetical protein